MIPGLLNWGFCWGLGGAATRMVGGIFFLLVFLTCLIGVRDGVGGDWGNYLPVLDRVAGLSFEELLLEREPGYSFFNWLAVEGGGVVFLVNSVCALIFSAGLLRFCRNQPRPWLALTVAFPYLVVVAAMG